jgi:1,2-phenylacetyl-CoA epoxidase PaaB subunit
MRKPPMRKPPMREAADEEAADEEAADAQMRRTGESSAWHCRRSSRARRDRDGYTVQLADE